MYKCTECNTVYKTTEAATNCHYGIGGVVEVETDYVYILTESAVNNPDDDSPTAEGDDPITRVEVYRDLEAANDRAGVLFHQSFDADDVDDDDDDNSPLPIVQGDGTHKYEWATSFNIYRIDVSKEPVR